MLQLNEKSAPTLATSEIALLPTWISDIFPIKEYEFRY